MDDHTVLARLENIGITLEHTDRLTRFHRKGNSLFDHIPDHPNMFLLEIDILNDVFRDVEQRLKTTNGIKVLFFGSMLDRRIILVSFDQ